LCAKEELEKGHNAFDRHFNEKEDVEMEVDDYGGFEVEDPVTQDSIQQRVQHQISPSAIYSNKVNRQKAQKIQKRRDTRLWKEQMKISEKLNQNKRKQLNVKERDQLFH